MHIRFCSRSFVVKKTAILTALFFALVLCATPVFAQELEKAPLIHAEKSGTKVPASPVHEGKAGSANG